MMIKVHKSNVTSKPVREMSNKPERDEKEQKKTTKKTDPTRRQQAYNKYSN